MKVLLVGANNFIGAALLPLLLKQGHEVLCIERDTRRLATLSASQPGLQLIKTDLLKADTMAALPNDIEIAYYLVNAASANAEFSVLESLSAHNFVNALNQTRCRQVIFLGRICEDDNPGNDWSASLAVEHILSRSKAALTVLRAAFVIGAGSPQFDIIRKIALNGGMFVAPKWINNLCQPIALADVLVYLVAALDSHGTYNRTFDIGGPDVLSYHNMMSQYAESFKMKFRVIVLPISSVKLSTYRVHRVASVSYSMAKSMVGCMQHKMVCGNKRIDEMIPHQCLNYRQALASVQQLH